MPYMRKSSNRGFTLIELSISLVLIGLIIGGVLKAQEMIESARVKRLEVQISRIQTGYLNYLDKYNRPAGDRDGDYKINYQNNNASENIAFFNDLLTTGTLKSAQPCIACETNPALAEAGKPYLKTPVSGGMYTGFRAVYGGVDYGFWLRVASVGDSTHGVIEDRWLSKYDSKVDDGDRDNGFVQLLWDDTVDNESKNCRGGTTGYSSVGNKCVFIVQPSYEKVKY